jgi:hypothetical protein
MSEPSHFTKALGFSRRYVEACTNAKLMELRDDLLRLPRPEDRRVDLEAVLEELTKRQTRTQRFTS